MVAKLRLPSPVIKDDAKNTKKDFSILIVFYQGPPGEDEYIDLGIQSTLFILFDRKQGEIEKAENGLSAVCL